MIRYLIDSSVAIEFYQPKAVYRSERERLGSKRLRKHITKQRLDNKAIIYIPSFCIAETLNIFDKWWHRLGNQVFVDEQHYRSSKGLFISHVQNRKFFYSLDFNRYHNLNADIVRPVEHTTDTEFQASGLPPGTDNRLIDAKLKEVDPADYATKHRLSTFDILIVAMGMELKRTSGSEVHLLTSDKRLHLISSQRPDLFPKAHYWPKLRVSDLPSESVGNGTTGL